MKFALIMCAAVFLASSGIAHHPECPAEPVTATLHTPAGSFYVLNELCQPDCLFSVWIFQESNGHPGLQREECRDIPADAWM